MSECHKVKLQLINQRSLVIRHPLSTARHARGPWRYSVAGNTLIQLFTFIGSYRVCVREAALKPSYSSQLSAMLRPC